MTKDAHVVTYIKMPKCKIPSNRVGACDQPWGHEGDMHQNAGDGFYAPDYADEHRRRQALLKAKSAKPTQRQRDAAARRVVRTRELLKKLSLTEREDLFKEFSLCKCANLTKATKDMGIGGILGMVVGGIIGTSLDKPRKSTKKQGV